MPADALRDPTWWYCVSCGTCANRCPVEINMYQVATTLCEMAEEAGIEPSEPAIHLFEELFLKSVRRHGRVRELSTVMRYNLQMRRPFQDAGKGLRLMLKGAISPLGMMGGGRKDPVIERIFARSAAVDQGESDHEG
jgi:heterodisulfide reductase subunit C